MAGKSIARSGYLSTGMAAAFLAMMSNGRNLLSAVVPVRKGRTKRSYSGGMTGKVVRVCPGRRHAWISSPVGIIRKPHHA